MCSSPSKGFIANGSILGHEKVLKEVWAYLVEEIVQRVKESLALKLDTSELTTMFENIFQSTNGRWLFVLSVDVLEDGVEMTSFVFVGVRPTMTCVIAEMI